MVKSKCTQQKNDEDFENIQKKVLVIAEKHTHIRKILNKKKEEE